MADTNFAVVFGFAPSTIPTIIFKQARGNVRGPPNLLTGVPAMSRSPAGYAGLLQRPRVVVIPETGIPFGRANIASRLEPGEFATATRERGADEYLLYEVDFTNRIVCGAYAGSDASVDIIYPGRRGLRRNGHQSARAGDQ